MFVESSYFLVQWLINLVAISFFRVLVILMARFILDMRIIKIAVDVSRNMGGRFSCDGIVREAYPGKNKQWQEEEFKLITNLFA